MSRALRTEHTARRSYPCEWAYHTPGEVCTRRIEKGERYVRAALPPGEEPMYAEGWWTMRYHAPPAPVSGGVDR